MSIDTKSFAWWAREGAAIERAATLEMVRKRMRSAETMAADESLSVEDMRMWRTVTLRFGELAAAIEARGATAADMPPAAADTPHHGPAPESTDVEGQ